jgi:uncharacterized protein (TIGR03663 family)
MSGSFKLCVLLAVLLGAGLRCARLDYRPLHTDESVNAIQFRQLWEGGVYRYDPAEHHGPTLAYATLAWQKLTLAPDFALWSDTRLRSLAVLFGVGLILLLPLVSDGLGGKGALAAAFFTAVSPVMVYYSRDYIHETLLVFFTFLAGAAGWRYVRERKLRWMLLAGAAVGLMEATKETFVFNLAAAGGAWLLTRFFGRRATAVKTPKPAPGARPWHLAAGAVAWLAVALLLFTSFLTNADGPLDAARTYFYWMKSAGGASPHVHGWDFYWRRLLLFHVNGGPVWSEALVLALAVWAGVAAFGRREPAGANPAFARFLVFYTALLAAVYTALPYKTPWCALGFWHGAVLLAGVGAAALVGGLRRPRLKIAAVIVLSAGAAQLALQAWQAGVAYAADPRNPWCYAQTSRDLLNLVEKVRALAEVSPEGGGMSINVMAPEDDYWPLPWYLRRYSGAGWWNEVPADPKVPVDPYAPVAILSSKLEAGWDAKRAGAGPMFFELRPGTFLELYVQTNLWSAYLRHR